MKLSDLIEEYIKEIMQDNNSIQLRRNELACMFKCVPSQINYVISTRFIPELGFLVESQRGGGGYIKISKIALDRNDYMLNLLKNMGDNLSQSVAYIYLDNFISYNILDKKVGELLKVTICDKSLENVENIKRDKVRASIFKNIILKRMKEE